MSSAGEESGINKEGQPEFLKKHTNIAFRYMGRDPQTGITELRKHIKEKGWEVIDSQEARNQNFASFSLKDKTITLYKRLPERFMPGDPSEALSDGRYLYELHHEFNFAEVIDQAKQIGGIAGREIISNSLDRLIGDDIALAGQMSNKDESEQIINDRTSKQSLIATPLREREIDRLLNHK